MADQPNEALGKNLAKWKGVGAQILTSYLSAENGGEGDDDNFGVDAFINQFEDEFTGIFDEDQAPNLYSPEANRAFEQMPWGNKYGNRPKLHEINQPARAQELGYRGIDWYPDRERKAQYYRLAGTPAELRVMLQILRATREITGNQISFETWFDLWEKGFPELTQNRVAGTNDAPGTTNFPYDGQSPWRTANNRPKYREWASPEQKPLLGFRQIEYWPDRSDESRSYLLCGTDADLIRHIIQIEYEGGSGDSISPVKSQQLRVSGQPMIILYFLQDTDDMKQRPDRSFYPRLTAEISLRIMDRTDDPRSELNKISRADLKRYADMIKEQFAPDDRNIFAWKRGKKVLCYNSPKQGFCRNWYLVNSQQEGIDLLSRLLKISDQKLERKNLRWGEAVDEAEAFPENNTPVQVLGEGVYLDSERRIGTVKFQRAEIKLPLRQKHIPLVKGSKIVFIP